MNEIIRSDSAIASIINCSISILYHMPILECMPIPLRKPCELNCVSNSVATLETYGQIRKSFMTVGNCSSNIKTFFHIIIYYIKNA